MVERSNWFSSKRLDFAEMKKSSRVFLENGRHDEIRSGCLIRAKFEIKCFDLVEYQDTNSVGN